MARTLGDIQISASLIEDYLHIAQAPLAASAGCFVAVEDISGAIPVHHLLSVDESNNLVHLRQDAQSSTGWTRENVNVVPLDGRAAHIAQIHALLQGGVLTALIQFKETRSVSLMEWTLAGGWRPASFLAPSGATVMFDVGGGSMAQTDLPAVLNSVTSAHVFAAGRRPSDWYGRQYFYGRATAPAPILMSNDEPSAPDILFVLSRDDINNVWIPAYIGPVSADASAENFYFLTDGTPQDSVGIFAIRPDGAYGWLEKTITDPATADAKLVGDTIAMTWSDQLWNSTLPPAVTAGTITRASRYWNAYGTDLTILMTGAGPWLGGFAAGGATGADVGSFSPLDMTSTSGPPPAGFASISAGCVGHDASVLFGLENGTQAMWIARPSGSADALFGPWTPLGNKARAIATPIVAADRIEVFYIGTDDGNPYRLAQGADGIWTTQQIVVPAPKATRPRTTATLTMEVRTLDDTGAPLSGVSLSVSTDRATTIIVGGIAHLVTSRVAATIVTDAIGSASVVMVPSGLVMPRLTFSAKTASATLQRWCQGDVVEIKPGETAQPQDAAMASRLAGLDPSFPVTGDRLVAAGLINPDYEDRDGAAAAIKAASQWMLNQQSPGGRLDLVAQNRRSWTLDIKTPAGPAFATLDDGRATDLLAGISGVTPGNRRGIADFFENLIDEGEDIADTAADKLIGVAETAGNTVVDGVETAVHVTADGIGDALNWLKHKPKEIMTFTVAAAEDVAGAFVLIVKLGENTAQSFVVRTVHQAGAALELIFTTLKTVGKSALDVVDDVLQWLKRLFGWDDILATSTVIKSCINNFFDQLEQAVGTLEAGAKSTIASVQRRVTAALDDAEKSFAGQTFNTYANSQARRAGNAVMTGNVLAGQPVRDAHDQNRPQVNYVYRHVSSGLESSDDLPAAGGGATSLFQGLAGTADDAGVKDLIAFMKDNLADPAKIFDIVIVELIRLLKKVVSLIAQGLDLLVTALLEAIVSAIKAMKDALNQPIDIPVVTWILTKAGVTSSLMDILCLTCAAPATILYKALFKGAAPFSKDDVTQLTGAGLPSYLPRSLNRVATREATVKLHWVGLPAMAGLINIGAAIASGYADYFAANEQIAPGTTPEGLIKVLSWVSWFTGLAVQALSAPFAVFEKENYSDWIAADHVTAALWCVTSVPSIYDLILILADSKLARFEGAVGVVVDTVAGFAALALGFTAAAFQAPLPDSDYTGWDVAGSMTQWGRVFKFLVLDKNPEWKAGTTGALVILDALFGIATCVTLLGGAITRRHRVDGTPYTSDERV